MGTKGPTGAGTQHTARGPVQGVRLVGPQGEPIDVIVDGSGTIRLAVDANVSIATAIVNVDIDSDTDNIAIRNTANNDELLIYPDGSIKIRLTDDSGVSFSAANPLPVEIISGTLDVEIDAADGDNIAIHDNEGHELEINPDGSINAVVTTGAGGDGFTKFDTALAVPTSTTTTIVTYTVPVGKTLFLSRIEVSGTNIATYEFLINTVIEGRRRTWFGGPISETFEFPSEPIELVTGDTIDVQVTNFRPSSGDFEARIQGELV